MRYRKLGSSGLDVSVVGLGCNNFGGRTDKASSLEVIRAALDAGITLFDTADVYGGGGASEEILGEGLRGHRDEVVVATKFGSPMGSEGSNRSGSSRAWITKALEDSLRRLGTDYVDLYQQHVPDPDTPIEETLLALDDAVRAGKVRYIGSSNFSGWQIADADWTSRAMGIARFVSAQNRYNLLDRSIETDLVPACKRFGQGILPYFPLASGLLTGKYKRDEEAPAGTRLADTDRFGHLLNDRNFDIVAALEAFASGCGRTLLDVAIGGLAAQPQVASVIAGATKPEQIEANVAAGSWVPDAGQLERLDDIAPAMRPRSSS